MDVNDEDLIAFWKAMNLNEVNYIMVGGFAGLLHGGTRITEDVDIWIEDSISNRARLRKTLSDIGIGDFTNLETMDFIPGWTTVYLSPGIELDIFTELKAFPSRTFGESLSKAYIAEIAGVKVPFLHLNQLIEEKKANARPKDLLDIEELELIKKMKEGDS